MQWSSDGGFSAVENANDSWIPINDNADDINVQVSCMNED